jgi:CDGSH-type Zn-finger protein
MADVRIRIRDNGPLVVDGPVTIVDAEGKPLTPPPSEKANVALCRCGASGNKPFCDGAHRGIEFNSVVRCEHQ